MSCKVFFSPAASDDLENLFIYLAPEMGMKEAREYVGEIKAYCLGSRSFRNAGCCAMMFGQGFVLSDIDARRP